MRNFVAILVMFSSFFTFAAVKQKFQLNLGDKVSVITWSDLDSDGNIYLLDGKNVLLFKINNNGKIVLEKERKGQGPGEFQYPSFIKYVDKTGILVSDVLRKQIVLLDKNFKFKANVNLPVFPINFTFNSGKFFILSDSLKNGKYSMLVYRVIGGKTPKIDVIFQGNELKIKKKMKINLDNSVGIFFDANKDYCAFIKQISDELLLYYQGVNENPGSLRRVRLPYKKIPLTKKEKREVIEEAVVIAKQTNPNANEKDLIAKNKIACNYFTLDEKDNAWLLVATEKPDVFKLICFNIPKRKIISTDEIKGFKNPAIEVRGNKVLIFEKSVMADAKLSLYQII